MDSKNERWFGPDERKAIANGCDVIVQEDIDSVCRPTLYPKIVDFVNDDIFDKLKKILKHSKERVEYKYGETGAITRADRKMAFIPVDGNYETVDLIGGTLFNALIDEHGNYHVGFGCIICMHNHPSNGRFSYSDLIRFLRFNSISAIVLVGNTHNVYILQKCRNSQTGRYFEYDRLIEQMKNRRMELLKNKQNLGITADEINRKVANEVLDNEQQNRLKLTHYKRRRK